MTVNLSVLYTGLSIGLSVCREAPSGLYRIPSLSGGRALSGLYRTLDLSGSRALSGLYRTLGMSVW